MTLQVIIWTQPAEKSAAPACISSWLAAPHGAVEKAFLPEAKAFTPSRDTYD